jgi:hypothetical protein
MLGQPATYADFICLLLDVKSFVLKISNISPIFLNFFVPEALRPVALEKTRFAQAGSLGSRLLKDVCPGYNRPTQGLQARLAGAVCKNRCFRKEAICHDRAN